MPFYKNLKTAQDLADEAAAAVVAAEKNWVKEELAVADIAIYLFEDG